MTPVLQSLSQLRSLYSEGEAATILNNCDHILYLGGTDTETVNYMAIRTRRNPESVMQLPAGRAWLLERGSKARLVDRFNPFAEPARAPEPSRQPEDDENLPFV